jgi:ribonuclease HI
MARAKAKTLRSDADSARRDETATLNRAIDAAVLASTPQPLYEFTAFRRTVSTTALVDKVCRRAAQLARRERARRAALIAARDAVILALYAQATPRGWMAAWCDGTTRAADIEHSAGIGGVIVDRRGRIIASVARKLTEPSALHAEIAAANAVLALAFEAGIRRVRLHTDCKGLVDLWLSRRDDPRLATLCAQAKHLDRVHMRLVPRRHNQAAHRLAHAATRGSGISALEVQDIEHAEPSLPDDTGAISVKDIA